MGSDGELTEQQKNIEWVRGLAVMPVTLEELRALPEYSASLPTGAIPGKRWRVNMHWRFRHIQPLWIIRRYEESPPEMHRGQMVPMVRAQAYRPVVRVPMGKCYELS